MLSSMATDRHNSVLMINSRKRDAKIQMKFCITHTSLQEHMKKVIEARVVYFRAYLFVVMAEYYIKTENLEYHEN